MTDPESPQSRIDALVRTAAAIEMELQATENELRASIYRVAELGGLSEAVAAGLVDQAFRNISANLANPDEGLSSRIH